MTATYEKSGLQFMYPENWTLAEDDMQSTPRTVSVQAPTGAFWSVDIYPFSIDMEQLLDQIVAAMKEEYEDLEAESATEEIGDEPATGFDLNFYCLDFLVTSQVRAFRHGHAVYLLTYQAEDREFDQLRDVFRAITASMLAAEAA